MVTSLVAVVAPTTTLVVVAAMAAHRGRGTCLARGRLTCFVEAVVTLERRERFLKGREAFRRGGGGRGVPQGLLLCQVVSVAFVSDAGRAIAFRLLEGAARVLGLSFPAVDSLFIAVSFRGLVGSFLAKGRRMSQMDSKS